MGARLIMPEKYPGDHRSFWVTFSTRVYLTNYRGEMNREQEIAAHRECRIEKASRGH